MGVAQVETDPVQVMPPGQRGGDENTVSTVLGMDTCGGEPPIDPRLGTRQGATGTGRAGVLPVNSSG